MSAENLTHTDKLFDLDIQRRARLAESLGYIFRQFGEHLDIGVDQLNGALEQIRAHRQDPGVFARYYDVVGAIDDARFEDARSLISEIIEKAQIEPQYSVIAYREKQLGSDFERFPRLLFSEFTHASPMAAPDDALFQSSCDLIGSGMEIVSCIDPQVHAEIEALVSRIYVAAQRYGNASRPFGGVTSFMIWGGLFVNATVHQKLWQMVHFLVHEGTHCWLFGVDQNDPLVKNDPRERFTSPLRTDPRPMDGIYHATIVCGRLALFSRNWADSSEIDKEARNETLPLIPILERQFKEGMSVINRDAELSDIGRQLIENISAEVVV